MIDINFYMRVHSLKQKLMNGEKLDKEDVYSRVEEFRSKTPVVYNIETTNACNMKCTMCPRTTMMTRKIENLDADIFMNIIDQLEPFSETTWAKWQDFVEKEYKISRNDMSENHFFLYIIPKVIQLHGYGDPLLDKHMARRLKRLSEKGLESYFSCNPANIDFDQTIEMMKNGLNYIKYSIESVDDGKHKEIRGQASDFNQSYEKILALIEEKKNRNFKTTFVITMLDLGRFDQQEEYNKLTKAFENIDVYIYLKSQDQQWYENKDIGTKSIHWSEFCPHPWVSMTIKSNGEAAMCMEDFNNDIILGDVRKESLSDIWNGKKYSDFRKSHFDGALGLKCSKECDMTLIGGLCR